MTDLPMGRWDATQWAWDDADAPPWDSEDQSDNNLFWAIEVDWDNDHAFDGSNEVARCIDYQGGLGRTEYLRIEGEDNDREATGFADIQPGEAQFTVLNDDGRYSERNVSSELYPNVKRGRMVRVRVKKGIDGTWHNRFAGVIDDIREGYDESSGERTVTFYLIGHEKKLQRVDANVGLQKNIKISQAIPLILTNIGWPSYLGSNIESTTAYLPYWWTQGRRAITELRDLANGDLGVVFCDGAGALTYYSRNHAGGVAVQINESECLKGIKQSSVLDSVCNKIEVEAKLRSAQAATTIAQLSGDTPLVPAGEARDWFLPVTYNGQSCPADNIVTPVATTDYLMNSAANGSGTNLTANFGVTYYDFGSVIKLTVRNNGGVDGYVTLLKVRGDPIISSTLLLKAEDATSQAVNGVLRMRYSSNWVQSANDAESTRDLLLESLKDSAGFFDIPMQDQFEKQFGDLFDVVELTLPTFSVAAENYRLAGYHDQWLSRTGQSVRTEMHLEPTIEIAGTWFIYNTSRWSVDTYYAP